MNRLCIAALPLAADRRLLPPALVESCMTYVSRTGSDFSILDANGHALRPAQLLPVNAVQAIAWPGHYFVFSSAGVTRITSDGTVLDSFPQALPFKLDRSFASDGPTFAIFDRDSEPHLFLFDLDFHFLSSRWTSGQITVKRAYGVRGSGCEASSITKDDKDQIAVAFEGTAASPKRLWYMRYDAETVAYDLFVGEPKSRVVRQ
jgi:hypothetical protein